MYVHAQILPDLDVIQEKLGLTNPSKDELEKLLFNISYFLYKHYIFSTQTSFCHNRITQF